VEEKDKSEKLSRRKDTAHFSRSSDFGGGDPSPEKKIRKRGTTPLYFGKNKSKKTFADPVLTG